MKKVILSISPGQMKKMINGLQDNVKRYEATVSNIQAAEGPDGKIVGFHT
jgi:hypothetical protein